HDRQTPIPVSAEGSQQMIGEPSPTERAFQDDVLSAGHAYLLQLVEDLDRLEVHQRGQFTRHDSASVGEVDRQKVGVVAVLECRLDEVLLDPVGVECSPAFVDVRVSADAGRLAGTGYTRRRDGPELTTGLYCRLCAQIGRDGLIDQSPPKRIYGVQPV